jgi:hypothetical protein
VFNEFNAPLHLFFFNPHKERFLIPKKSYLIEDSFSIAFVLFFEGSVVPQNSLSTLRSFSDPRRPESSRARGDAQKRTSIKTQNLAKVKRLFGPSFCF